MSDFQRINAIRVVKVMAVLDIIEKSGKSNRVLPANYEELLGSIFDRIQDLTQGGPDTPVEDEPEPYARKWLDSPSKLSKSRTDLLAADAIDAMPIEQLPLLLARIMNRIDDGIHKGRIK
jgi:hypothetical protein